MEIRLYQHCGDAAWFLAGDLSVVALDTETMGKTWWAMLPELDEAEGRVAANDVVRRLKACANEALDEHKNYLALVQLASADGRVLLIVQQDPQLVIETAELLTALLEIKPLWLLHNAKFDFKQIGHHFNLFFDDQRVHDTMVVEGILHGFRDNSSLGLGAVAKRYEVEKSESPVRVSDWWRKPLSGEQQDYAARDVYILHTIYAGQLVKMSSRPRTVLQLENRIPAVLTRMEATGITFDKGMLEEFRDKANTKVAVFLETYNQYFEGVNPNSPKQVMERFDQIFGYVPEVQKWNPTKRIRESVRSVDKTALILNGVHTHPGVEAMLAIKEISKNVEMAEGWLNHEGPLRTNYQQMKNYGGADEGISGGTRTGRLSSSPNLQNISNFMKQFVVPPEGFTILSADYAAIEMRMMASYANDAAMKRMFNEGIDPHSSLAAKVTGRPITEIGKKSEERHMAKCGNFLFIYAGRPARFASQCAVQTGGQVRPTLEQAERFYQEFFELFYRVQEWHNTQFPQACWDGFVTSRSGRRRYYHWGYRPADISNSASIHHPRHGWFNSKYAPDWKWRNMAFNTPIQGSAADGLKLALVKLNPRYTEWFQPMGTVHDSIDTLVLCDKIDYVKPIVRDCMISGMHKFLPDVAVEVELTAGGSWANQPSDLESEHGLWVQTAYQKETT